MQRGTSRKFAIIALGVMTLALVVVGVVILFQIQNTQDPDNADAFGFGSSANPQNFTAVGKALFATPCNFYLNKYNLSFTGNEDLNAIGTELVPFVSDDNQPYTTDTPKYCLYSAPSISQDGPAIGMAISTYPENAAIDASPQDLYNRVNPTLITNTSEPVELLNQVYFYGPSVANPQNCTAVLFHKQNDFEYIAITLYGQPCNVSQEYIDEVVDQVAGMVEFVMSPFLVEGFYEYEIPDSSFIK